MEFRKIKIAELIPAAYNPRKKLKSGDKEYEKIKNSIQEFGYVEPVIVNADMTIIGGHQRVTVLSDLGYEEIDCVIVDVDKAREKALNIALNKITGEWDEQRLAELLKDIQDSDFDIGKTGFEPPEIEQLFNKVHDKNIEEDEFDVDAELGNPAFSKAGDLWGLGRSPYQWQHEPCLFGWKKGGRHQWYSDRKQTIIWEYARPKASKEHPTMKPVGLMGYPIRNSTMTNGIVLDPFLGSGSTLIACEETDRVCRGIELEEKFVDVIVKRYIQKCDGRYEDVYVMREGQKLLFEEVIALEENTVNPDNSVQENNL